MDNKTKLLSLAAKSDGETIGEHTKRLLDDFEILINIYGNHFTDEQISMIKIAIEYHDYGKALYCFQKLLDKEFTVTEIQKNHADELYKLYSDNKNAYIPHGYISPVFLDYEKLKNEFGIENLRIIINAIYFHHNKKPSEGANIIDVLNKDIRTRFPEIASQKNFYLTKIFNSKANLCWEQFSIVMGILNRCDYHASSHSDIPIEISPLNPTGKGISDIVYEKITKRYSLRAVQQYMKDNSNENLVVTASTGIGKTEAALMWAANNKLFYTLPLKVSINAIYKRIIGKNDNEYGFDLDKCTLLHSDAFKQLIEEDSKYEYDNARKKYIASKMFSYPVTVCTVDQLFTFVYKYHGSELLLATLKYSKLIIDEIQSYTPKIVAKLIIGLKMISDCGGKFAIITATMPPVFKHFMEQEKISYKQERFLSDNPRHRIKIVDGDFDYEKITELGKSKKVLVICTTVNKAMEVYSNLKTSGAKLLHSHFIQEHRALLEAEIMQFSNSQEKVGIWISTQIVEASLDIDFDYLFTEMSTADSLLQRLGRCFRKRIYCALEPNINIYLTGSGIGKIYSNEIYSRSIDKLWKYDGEIFTEEDKADYIDKVYDVTDLKGTEYFYAIKQEIDSRKFTNPWDYKKEEAQKAFRDIEAIRVMPESIYNNECEKMVDFDELVNTALTGKGKAMQEANEYINSKTMSLGVYILNNKKYSFESYGALAKMGIYICKNLYEFDEENLIGGGLMDVLDNKVYS